MKKFTKLLTKTIDVINLIFIITLVLCVILQVVVRFSGISVPWTEEIARLLFVFITFLGAAVAIEEDNHIAIPFVIDKLPPFIRKIINIIIYALMSIFIILIIKGSPIMIGISKNISASTLRWLKMSYVYYFVLAGSILMLFYCILKLWENIQEILKHKTGGGK